MVFETYALDWRFGNLVSEKEVRRFLEVRKCCLVRKFGDVRDFTSASELTCSDYLVIPMFGTSIGSELDEILVSLELFGSGPIFTCGLHLLFVLGCDQICGLAYQYNLWAD